MQTVITLLEAAAPDLLDRCLAVRQEVFTRERGVPAAVENRFRAEGLSAVVLDAKCSARGFYEACGYEAVSGEFLEAGVPHVAMRRAL